MEEKKEKKFLTAKDILTSNEFLNARVQAAKYVTKEFQDYGYRLAVRLGDVKRAALYIKLAKTVNRDILEQALSFTIDYPKAQNKSKLFLWKMKELRSAQQVDEKLEQANKTRKKVENKIKKDSNK